MYSKVKILGRAVHPMLVSFPIVFYTAAFVCFCLFQNTANLFWYRVAFIANLAGVVAAAAAAVPGSIDLFIGVPKNTEPRRRGYLHAALNVSSLILFAINLYLIWGTFNMSVTPNSINAVITGIGFGLTVVAAYHGHTLVARDKVGVDLTPEQERIEIGRRPLTT
ncbi:DUF2231 domain-containing protein [Pseudobdellovibrio sp. HCB154]|uniref:DUF2231 domain-containing protein n=1 Tax=Pseudobdellovibrio sp. HCB154 TaxID=3386277 RepID=UPI00391723A8